jgi:hypothetical protein
LLIEIVMPSAIEADSEMLKAAALMAAFTDSDTGIESEALTARVVVDWTLSERETFSLAVRVSATNENTTFSDKPTESLSTTEIPMDRATDSVIEMLSETLAARAPVARVIDSATEIDSETERVRGGTA